MHISVIGGGLAGSEAAWQAANCGVDVILYEMRPAKGTGAHTGSDLAELVCSNSLGSNLIENASGLLKEELRQLGSLLIQCADRAAVPAGSSLAVDRVAFSRIVTEKITSHPRITLIREEIQEIMDGVVIIASGPLTSAPLVKSLAKLTSSDHLFFYDAIAPIVSADSINMEIAFRGSRYGKGELEAGDYLNCPLDKDQYFAFVNELLHAERIEIREFEREILYGVRAGAHRYFEGCLPVEILAERDIMALAYGPMRPVGLIDPHTGRRPFAVVQLRQDNLAGTLYNMVGFQTNLKYQEQKRIFRMIPGLEKAEFVRYGQMHRNTFINSPKLLEPTLQLKNREEVFFAGQITGVEGYAGNIATGLLAGLNAARLSQGKELLVMPRTTMIGSLCHYVTHASESDFQPMKANFGILPLLEEDQEGYDKGSDKRERKRRYVQRALEDLKRYMERMESELTRINAHSH